MNNKLKSSSTLPTLMESVEDKKHCMLVLILSDYGDIFTSENALKEIRAWLPQWSLTEQAEVESFIRSPKVGKVTELSIGLLVWAELESASKLVSKEWTP